MSTWGLSILLGAVQLSHDKGRGGFGSGNISLFHTGEGAYCYVMISLMVNRTET